MLWYEYLLLIINRELLEALEKSNGFGKKKAAILLNSFCFLFVVCYFPSSFVLRDVWTETELVFLNNFLLLLCVPSSGWYSFIVVTSRCSGDVTNGGSRCGAVEGQPRHWSRGSPSLQMCGVRGWGQLVLTGRSQTSQSCKQLVMLPSCARALCFHCYFPLQLISTGLQQMV